MAVLVCLLALGVASLASTSKRSQYGPEPGLGAHFSQQTKMSNDGAQTSADFDCTPPAVFAPPVPAAEPLVPVARSHVPRRARFFEAFRLRPPPFPLV